MREKKKKSPHYSLFYCVRGSVCGGEQHFPSKGRFETNFIQYSKQNNACGVSEERSCFSGHLLSPGSLRRLGSADLYVFVRSFLQICALPKQNAAVGLATMCPRTTRCTLGPFACPANSHPLQLRACTDLLTSPRESKGVGGPSVSSSSLFLPNPLGPPRPPVLYAPLRLSTPAVKTDGGLVRGEMRSPRV